MDNPEIHSANITVIGADDTGAQIKIRDQNRQTYSFFKNKKDGSETEAYKSYQQFKIGDNVLVTFKEVPYKDSIIKNVMTFKPATGEPDKAAATTTAQWKARTGSSQRPGREYWEKREAKRQSSILMQVAFKSAVAVQTANIRAGHNEDRDKLYRDTLEFYDWMAEHVGEETGEKISETSSQAKVEAGRDDEIIF